MNYKQYDIEFHELVDPILNNKEFLKIDNDIHHGITRLEHSLRVSYYSYIVSKKVKLNTKSVTKASLLHDFFTNDEFTYTEKRLSAFTHPKKSLMNAKREFYLSEMEEDIIFSHMFPLIPNRIPKYLESWLVSIVDKIVATYEFIHSYAPKYIYKFQNSLLLFVIAFSRFS